MALFDPVAIGRKLVAGMGVDPDKLLAMIDTIMSEVAVWKAEREAFKRAVKPAHADLVARLERIEKTLDLLAKDFLTPAIVDGVALLNGDQKHDG